MTPKTFYTIILVVPVSKLLGNDCAFVTHRVKLKGPLYTKYISLHDNQTVPLIIQVFLIAMVLKRPALPSAIMMLD